MKTDERGFNIYDELEDTYGARIKIKHSSTWGMGHGWIFVEGGSITDNKGSIHMDIDIAKKIIAALKIYVKEAQKLKFDD